MLAALIASQNSHRLTAAATVRKSAGRSTAPNLRPDIVENAPAWSRHDIVDIAAAAAIFPEIAGEDPITRAQRRLRWIEEVLPHIQETREKREAVTFLMGAQLADAAAQDHLAAREQGLDAKAKDLTAKEEALAAKEKLSLEQLNQIIDEVRTERAKASPKIGTAIAISLVVGATIGAALMSRRRRTRKR